ncbi:MAG: HTTM domain-containing protein [Planctomycetota bacterium]|jgi:hypothetical protein
MIRDWFRSLIRVSVDGWNGFWFAPTHPATLSVIRICTGLLLFYSQIVWALNSTSFLGPEGWINESAAEALRGTGYGFSLLSVIDTSPTAIVAAHAVALIVSLLLTVGLFSRLAAPAAFLVAVSFANRNTAALYGFDQIIGFLTLYLSINPGHGWLSLDAWIARRRMSTTADRRGATAGLPGSELLAARNTAGQASSGTQRSFLLPGPSVTIATRLIQLHLCLLYFVAGISKLKGATWWSGVAFWGAIANQEYQTVDLTELVHWPIVINVLTHLTLAWEISYPFLVWNRWLRPFVLAMAVAVHVGIGVCFGMLTFGSIMIVANLAFVSPALVLELAGLARGDRSDANTSDGRSARLSVLNRRPALQTSQ